MIILDSIAMYGFNNTEMLMISNSIDSSLKYSLPLIVILTIVILSGIAMSFLLDYISLGRKR